MPFPEMLQFKVLFVNPVPDGVVNSRGSKLQIGDAFEPLHVLTSHILELIQFVFAQLFQDLA